MIVFLQFIILSDFFNLFGISRSSRILLLNASSRSIMCCLINLSLLHQFLKSKYPKAPCFLPKTYAILVLNEISIFQLHEGDILLSFYLGKIG